MCFLRASLMLLSELIFSTFWQLEMRSSLSVCLDLLSRYFLIWRRNRMRAIVIHSSITHVKKMLAGWNINKNVLLKERNTQMLSCLWSNTFSFLEPSVEARNSPFWMGNPSSQVMLNSFPKKKNNSFTFFDLLHLLCSCWGLGCKLRAVEPCTL